MGLLADMQRSSRERVASARARCSAAELRHQAEVLPPPPPLVLAGHGFDLIAELKLRSPLAGALDAQTADPLDRLDAYARGGAVLVSVLTEPTRFDGSLEHLRLAADRLGPQYMPVMRKDFLVDPYQVIEARVHGASGVLLIVRMVPRAELEAMLDCAAELGLFVLLEAFDADDLATARELAAARRGRIGQVLMGLNCRDLDTLAIDTRRFAELRDAMPRDWPAVAESGIATPADAASVSRLGYRMALVGTSLMQRPDPECAVAELLAAGRPER
jgi:indole-3-glycerol phosphate synthase